jgi:hypothetical protein
MTILADFNNRWHWLPFFVFQFDDEQEQKSWFKRNMSLSIGWGPFAMTLMNYSHMCVYNGLIDMVEYLVDNDQDKHERLMKLLDNPEVKYTHEEFARAIQNIRDH